LLPCYFVTLLPCYSVTLLPCYSVTMLPCFFVTLLLCNSVTLLHCYSVTSLPCYSVTLLPCYSFILLPCHFVTLLPCYLVTFLLCYSVTLLLCYLVTLLPCYLVTLLLCYLVTLLLCYLVTLLLCYLPLLTNSAAPDQSELQCVTCCHTKRAKSRSFGQSQLQTMENQSNVWNHVRHSTERGCSTIQVNSAFRALLLATWTRESDWHPPPDTFSSLSREVFFSFSETNGYLYLAISFLWYKVD